MADGTYLDDNGNPLAAPPTTASTPTYLDDSGNPMAKPADPSATIGPQKTDLDPGALVRSKVREIENYTQQGQAEHPVMAAIGSAMKRIWEPAPEPKIKAEPVPPFPGLNLDALEPSAAPAAAAAKPGIVSQIRKGEEVAQPQAQEAFRDAASQATPGATAQPFSIREGLSDPIDTSELLYKKLYAQIDEAAGTDIKALREKLGNTEYQIRQLTDTEADRTLEGKLETARTGLIDRINEAQKAAIANGVDPATLQKADQAFTQTQALKDVETKIFKNPNVVVGNAKYGTNETINVDSAIKALQRMEDVEKFGGSRLEQAFGKEGANNLLNNLYQAQKMGQRAVSVQNIAKWVAKGTVAVAGGAAAYVGLKK